MLDGTRQARRDWGDARLEPIGGPIAHVIATVETAWLFTRGCESVRIVRAVARSGVVHLGVQGPGEATDTRDFTDVLACMNYQADLERRLVAAGFTLAQFTSDRRATGARHRLTERRGLLPMFL